MTSDTATFPPSGEGHQDPGHRQAHGRGHALRPVLCQLHGLYPTRASLMTGRYPDLVGAPSHPAKCRKQLRIFNPTGPTLPELMSKAGYHTGMVGKWHLGYESPNLPNDRGFEFFHGFLGDMMDDYWTHLRGGVNWMRKNKEVIKPKGHATEIFSQWAIDYIKEQSADKKKPFFLYLAYNAPHFPIQPQGLVGEGQEARAPTESKTGDQRCVRRAHGPWDRQGIGCGQRTGDREGYLITFSSDNGGSIPHAATNDPWRGGKQGIGRAESACRPAPVWPGKIPVGRSNELGITMDYLPAFCEIAGIKVENEIEGKSLAPIWLGEPRVIPTAP